MPRKSNVSLILPAYNEAKSIGKTIEEAGAYFKRAGHSCEIIVSADGADGTRELVLEMARSIPFLKVIGSPKRQGKGRAVRLGVQMAQGDIIGFIDADNKTPIDEFGKFEPFLSEGYEVVIGSRGLPQSRIERRQPLYRKWGARGFAVLMHAIMGLRGIVDTQCGFKFFQRRTALDLFAKQKIDGYMFDVEILYLAAKAGYRIAQVPIRWRDDGDSRYDVVSGSLSNLADLVRIRLGGP